jgi:nicotinamidase-related amidase
LSDNNRMEYFEYLDDWKKSLPEVKIADIIRQPDKTAVFIIDVTNGFCSFGPLSSKRVGSIVEPIVEMLKICWDTGIRSFLLPQDSHDPQAEEFSEYPPHCVRGTPEADTVDKIRELPFFDRMCLFEKNSINSGINPGIENWLEAHPEIDTYILVGDCTDLCIYQLATYLKAVANEHQFNRRVIIPENCVNTYDMPVNIARETGAYPHCADVLHVVFLNHMAMNGVEIYRKIIA